MQNEEDDDGQDVFHWYVDCINRETHARHRKDLVLDESLLTDTQQKEFHHLIAANKRDRNLLKFRPYFIETESDKLDAMMRDCNTYCTVNSLLPPGGYFEDENGAHVTELGMWEIATGDPNLVIGGDVFSCYRLGAAGIKDKESWTLQKANDVAHFLDLVRQIQTSNWQKMDLKMTTQGGKILEIQHADRESTRSFLFSLRQLLMPARLDDTFNLACNIYIAHVSNPTKAAWVKHEQDKFRDARNHVPFPFQLDTYTMEDVIDMMTYGARVAHRKSNKNWEQKLPEIIEKHGKERFQFVFQASCKTLMNFPFAVAPIIGQDFGHWIKNEGCIGPNRVSDADLF